MIAAATASHRHDDAGRPRRWTADPRLLPDYEAPSRPIHLRYSPDRRPPPKLRSFIDAVMATFGEPALDAQA